MPQPYADQFRSIPMSTELGESLERAHGFAREQGHRAVTLEHLLLAFTEDPDAAAVLQASQVDLVRLRTDVSGYLGRLPEDMREANGADPQTDPELMRVLHAAVQAAQQSRRRQIDGAIVLAAVVGDGKSAAAGLLKAHGLTFEDAIRALQRASAKANAQARSRQFAAPLPTTPVPPGQSASSAGALPDPSSEPAGGRVQEEGPGQSVEEILDAARARIQQRTAAIVGKGGESNETPAGPPQFANPETARTLPTPPNSEPVELPEKRQTPQTTLPATVPASSSPPQPPAARTQSDWALSAPAAQASRLPPAPPRHAAQPLPQPPLQPAERPPPPPLPHRARSGGLPLQAGLPGRPAPAPRLDTNQPTSRPPPANGALTGAALHPTPRRAGQRTGGQTGHGPLVETIPRRMRLGVPAAAQVRISRDRIDGLILLLMKGRGMTHRPDALIMRALSVRLRAPDGGFWIAADSPETQWVETAPRHHQDDHVGWRWTVTPQRRGRGRLVLVVAARTIGRDGLAAEIAPPDRIIEVTVTGGRLRSLVRWCGFLAALLLGLVLGRFGNELWAFGVAVLKGISAL